MVEGILFEQVEDSRQDWKVKHSISEILTVVMCGVSAGERSIYGIREFARLKEQWLRDVIGLKLPNGLPSYDTVRRVLGLLDPKQFQSVFIRWIEQELEIPAGSYVSLDIQSGAIIHSDSGSQYTSSEYKKMLGQLHAIQSMSGVGKCWDNARMESWFATLKKEKLYQLDTTKLTVEEVKTIVWRYTFAYYNTKRITTVNPDGLPPVAYREKTASKTDAA